MGPRTKSLLAQLPLLGVVGLCMAYCAVTQHNRYQGRFRPGWIFEQKMKLPPSSAIRLFSFGYHQIYSDYLWLKSVQALGSKWKTADGTMEGVRDYFDKMTDLDPHFIRGYEMSNMVIADTYRDYERSLSLLAKGTWRNPTDYQIPYLGIYTAIWGMEQPDRARYFSYRINKIPDVPDHIRRMEEYIERKSGRYRAAFDINLGYYLKYSDAKDEVQADVMLTRFRDVLDRWGRDSLRKACERFVSEKGHHPTAIEDVLEFLEPYEAPTMSQLLKAVRELPPNEPLLPHRDQIRDHSYTTIRGLPPDPFGTWYYIDGRSVPKPGSPDAPTTAPLEMRFPYIMAFREGLEENNAFAMHAQEAILAYESAHGGAKPSDGVISNLLIEDRVGGHWIFGRDTPTGTFESTAGRRVRMIREEHVNAEPRLGLQGLPPWPMQPEPTIGGTLRPLKPEVSIWDYKIDADWARSRGIPEGKEPWEHPPRRITLDESPDTGKLTEGGGYVYDEREIPP